MSAARSIGSRFRRSLGRLARDCAGGAAVEFAFVAPLLLLFMLGIIEVAMILFATSLLEASVREAARYGITGYTYAGVSRESVIRSIVANDTVGLIDVSKLTVSSLTYKTFTDIGQPEPFTDKNHNGKWDPGEAYTDINGNGQWDADMGASGAGGPGDVVLYTVSYQWPLITGYLSDIMGLHIPLSASYAVRNEPWG
jgi:Flp pilus assembly protein TadG